jgi:hypothetical protein
MALDTDPLIVRARSETESSDCDSDFKWERMTWRERMSASLQLCVLNSRWVLWSNLLFFLATWMYIAMAAIDVHCADRNRDPLPTSNANQSTKGDDGFPL